MAGDANEYKSTYHEGARQFVGELNFLWIEIFLGNVELGVERLCTADCNFTVRMLYRDMY